MQNTNHRENNYDEFESNSSRPKLKKLSLKKVILVLLLLGFIFAVIFYISSSRIQEMSNDKVNTAADVSALVAKVSKLMVLPATTPNVFVIQDPDSLSKSQTFFIGAKKGDRLLVYPEARKAIIYSIDRNIIINSGPVDFDGVSPEAASGIVPTKTK